MRSLSVVSVEDGALVVVSDTGERFGIRVDDALRSMLRDEPATGARRLTPREIQAQVRAGLSPQQVAAVSGAPLGYVERFVGPVLAERRYVVDSALATSLPATDDGRSRTFGAVMTDRLTALAADGVRWTSAKETSGWVVGVEFTADGVEHDARWRFDAKRQQLSPENVEAATLSQEGVPAALTPRLRAIEPTGPVRVAPPEPPSRFDSQAFVLPETAPATPPAASERPAVARREPPVRAEPARPAASRPEAVEPASASVPAGRTTAAGRTAGGLRDPAPTQAMQTVRAAHRAEVGAPAAPRTAPSAPIAPAASVIPVAAATPVTPIRARADDEADDDPPQRPIGRQSAARRGRPRDGRRTGRDETAPTRPVSLPGRGRGGRASMPSWDEIVFGRDED